MGMTKADAARILDPETSREALLPYAYDGPRRLAVVEEACRMGAAALRPVSRERVEQVWRGEWMFPIFADGKDANDPRCQCSECGSTETPLTRHRFCPSCGAPMTDEAVDIVIRRLEALHGQKNP